MVSAAGAGEFPSALLAVVEDPRSTLAPGQENCSNQAGTPLWSPFGVTAEILDPCVAAHEVICSCTDGWQHTHSLMS